MKKSKIKERFENAVDAFFDNDALNEETDITYTDNSAFYQKEISPDFFEKNKTLFAIFKQVFLFFPGALVLYLMTIVLTSFLILRPPFAPRLWIPFSIVIISALMTFLGLGDWRKPKHLLIPASIMTISIILGIIGSLTHGTPGFGLFIQNYAIYFFPLALITPFLVKGLIDQQEEEA